MSLVDAARLALAALAQPISPSDEDGQALRRSARNALENALQRIEEAKHGN